MESLRDFQEVFSEIAAEVNKRIYDEVILSFDEIFKESTSVTKKIKRVRKSLDEGGAGGDSGESQYSAYLSNLHRKLSTNCICIYNAFYRSFQTFFCTGKTLIQRTGSRYEPLNKVYSELTRQANTAMSASNSPQPISKRDKLAKSSSFIFTSLTSSLKKHSSEDLSLSVERNRDKGTAASVVAVRGKDCSGGVDAEDTMAMDACRSLIGQIADNERKYLRGLRLLSAIRRKLETGEDGSATNSSSEDIGRIFGNLNDLIEVENWVNDALSHCASSPDPHTALSKALNAHRDAMERVYSEYARNSGDSRYTYYRVLHGTAELEAAIEAAAAATVVTGGSSAAKGQRISSLSMLLDAPCRHVGRLQMYVQSVLEGPRVPGLGAISLAETAASLGRMATAINEVIRAAERRAEMVRVRDAVKNYDDKNLEDSGRSFVYDGLAVLRGISPCKENTFYEVSANKGIDAKLLIGQEYHPILLSDALLICKQAQPSDSDGEGDRSSSPSVTTHQSQGQSQQDPEQDSPQGSQLLCAYEVCTQLPVATISVGEDDSESGGRSFVVSYRAQSYTFGVPTAAACRAWVGALRSAGEKRNTTQVFGVPIGRVMAHEGEKGADIPRFLASALNVFLSETDSGAAACRKEGIFRISGSRLQMTQLQRRIDAGETPDMDAADPHVVASLVKLWFHSLPRAIILFEDFQEAFESKDVEGFRGLLEDRLSQTERFILLVLFKALRRVLEFGSDNKMDTYSVCVVVAPFLIKPRAAKSAILCSGSSTSMVEFMFNNFDELFGGIEAEHAKFVRRAERLKAEQKTSLLDELSQSLGCSQRRGVPLPQSLSQKSESPKIEIDEVDAEKTTKKKYRKPVRKDSEREADRSPHKSSRKKHRDCESASPVMSVIQPNDRSPGNETLKVPKRKSRSRVLSDDVEVVVEKEK